MHRYLIAATVAAVALLGVVTANPTTLGTAGAAPGTQLVSDTGENRRVREIVVHSAAMDRDIPLTVITPRNTSKPRGVVYMLNGAGGGEDRASWTARTDMVDFYSNKDVYVVIPNQGAFSYYTDWQRRDPTLGVNKWSTFLGKELPGVIDGHYNTSGRNVIGGISSSATSVLNLAIEHPGLYQGVAAYSGCLTTADPVGQNAIRLVVETRGTADATNMWGPYTGAGWRAHDPTINAAKLRGTDLYISNATGIPGVYDTPRYVADTSTLVDQIFVGGGIEAVSLACTIQFLAALGRHGIPATVDVPPTGTHSWGYWQDQMHRSWPFFAKALRY